MTALLLLAALVPQTTWYVDASAIAPGAGTLASPYASIGYAMARPLSVTGDTISVAPGTYIDELIDFDGKDIHLVSQSGAAQTTVIPPAPTPGVDNSTVRFENAEGPGAILEGFRFLEGAGTVFLPGPSQHVFSVGGAVFVNAASPRIIACEFEDNRSEVGGGVFLHDSSAVIRDCVARNTQAISGSALFVEGGNVVVDGLQTHDCTGLVGLGLGSGATIVVRQGSISLHGCSLLRSSGIGPGGAIALFDAIAFIDSTVIDSSHSDGDGGGLLAENSVLVCNDLSFVDCESTDGHGGAVYLSGGSITLQSCSFERCSAGFQHDGGAVHATGVVWASDSSFVDNDARLGGAVVGSGTFIGCLFEGNRATGNFLAGDGGAVLGGGTFERCVFVNNEGQSSVGTGASAIQSGPGSGTATARRCTFVGNVSAGASGTVRNVDLEECLVWANGPTPLTGQSTATYSLIEGLWPGIGNIDVAPLLWSPTDPHLLPASPAIDAGNPASAPDPDGTRRDVGAATFDPFYCGAGCEGPQGALFCLSAPNSTGYVGRLSGIGTDVAASNLLILVGEDLPPGAVGYMLASRTSGFVPFFGGSQGVLCLGGSILRFSNTVFTSTPGGVVAFQPDLLNLPGGNSAISGDTWLFQAWHRDVVGGVVTSNTTSGLEMMFE